MVRSQLGRLFGMAHKKSNSLLPWWAAGGIAVVGAAAALYTVNETPSDSSTCSVDSLPAEAGQQIDDILSGAAPDHGRHDGKHFGNYEGLLPEEKSDFYREYTVTTPGITHRGERRIVVGGGTKTNPEVWYYSSDHFKSFCTITDAALP